MTKLNKKTINTFSNVEVMAHFERVTIKLTKEANRMRGETKQTLKEYEILKETANAVSFFVYGIDYFEKWLYN